MTKRNILAAAVLAACTAACAAVPHVPQVDLAAAPRGGATYDADLAACQIRATEIAQAEVKNTDRAADVAGSAAEGAILGGLVGLITGNFGEALAIGAATGAASEAISPSGATYEDFYDIAVERCIIGRGYRVLNPVTDGS